MLNFLFSLCVFLGTSPLWGSYEPFPYFIDFSSDEFATHCRDQEFFPERVTTYPFNGALEMSTFFMYVKEEFHIQTAIETGTYQANTAGFLGSLFDVVHTIELIPAFHAESAAFLQPFPNTQCHLGNSPEVLGEILPTLAGQRVLFYLDAHWQNDWPLLEELRQISNTHQDNCMIVIDDFKVPGRSDIPYDGYGGNDCEFEYIQSHLDLIFPNGYTAHYLIPQNVKFRAKFVAIPIKWSPGGL